MSLEKYFVEGFGSEQTYEELKASKIFPLVRELQFTYGLKVYQKSQGDCYMLCHPNGFAVGHAWYDHDETQFKYRSPWYRKQRGSSASDRETVSSVKISSLMATLKRMEAVPAMEKTTHNYVRRLTDAVSRLRRELGSHNKDHGLTGDEVHALLLTVDHYFHTPITGGVTLATTTRHFLEDVRVLFINLSSDLALSSHEDVLRCVISMVVHAIPHAIPYMPDIICKSKQ